MTRTLLPAGGGLVAEGNPRRTLKFSTRGVVAQALSPLVCLYCPHSAPHLAMRSSLRLSLSLSLTRQDRFSLGLWQREHGDGGSTGKTSTWEGGHREQETRWNTLQNAYPLASRKRSYM